MLRHVLAALLLPAALLASSASLVRAQAHNALQNTLRTAEYSRDPRAIVGALLDLARFYREQGRVGPALEHARRALTAAQGAGARDLVDRSWEELIACQERAGNPAGALALFRRYKEEHDRAVAAEERKQLDLVEQKYQAERRALENERAQREAAVRANVID